MPMADDLAQPRLILWDIDHTLIETRGLGSQLARAAFAQITGQHFDELAEATGKTEPVIVAETLRLHGIEPTESHQQQYAQALPEQYRRHANQLRARGRELPGAREALDALAKIPGVVQTVLTGNYRAVAAVKLDTFDLNQHIDLDIGAYAEDGTDRATIVPVAQRRASTKYHHQFSHNNTIIIGDTTHDIAAAHHGGAAIVAVATGRDSANDLRNAGAEIVLADLTNPAGLISAIFEATGPQLRS